MFQEDFQENEIISCILAVGVVLFVLVNYRLVIRIPRSSLLLSALMFFLLSIVFSICEGLWEDAFNVYNALEHLCYMINLLFLAVWCGIVYRRGGPGNV